MHHWTIGKLFFATAVVAFLAMLSQAEGCGEHRSHISDLQLSPDGKMLAVARADGRVAYGTYDMYFSDLWMTRSLIRADDGRVAKTLDSYPVSGWNSDLRHQRKKPAFAMSQQNVFIAAEDRTLECFDFQGKKRSSAGMFNGVERVAVSGDETYLLYNTSFAQLAILTSGHQHKELWRHHCDPYYGAIAISGDRFAVLDEGGVRYGTLKTNDKVKTTFIPFSARPGNSIAFAKSTSMIAVALDNSFDLIDLTTEKIQRFPFELVGFSNDRDKLLFKSDEGLRIMDLESGERSSPLPYTTKIACLSDDGERLFFTRAGHTIVCVELKNGKELWSTSAPGHYRPGRGWLVGMALLCVFVYRSYQKRGLRRLVKKLKAEQNRP